MSPVQKAVRTIVQVIIGAGAATTPLVVALHLPAATVGVIAGSFAAAGGLAALVQNALEDNGLLPRRKARP